MSGSVRFGQFRSGFITLGEVKSG